MKLGRVKRMVGGYVEAQNGLRSYQVRSFQARSDEAAIRYWTRWVEGNNWKPVGTPIHITLTR